MVGRNPFAGIRERLQQVSSNESGHGYHPPQSGPLSPGNGTEPGRHHVPFIASPLDPKTTKWLHKKHESGNLTLMRRATVAQAEATRVSGGIFRKQHEASPIELFFDLFFVANLAVFTYNHTQTTRQSVGNYIGFFSLMWTFWFHISIHDVRFYVDSILNRFIKMCQFAMFTAFTGLGPIYAVIEEGGSTRAFQGLALVFMLSRFILVIQYGVVLWFVRPLKKTLVPLSLMMLLYFLTAIAFLVTYLTSGPDGSHHIQGWYIIIIFEALFAVIISSIWRILSFKRTHLVERVGLLTLIVMGEGIIGVIKSISYILDGTILSIWDATGRVIGSVFLIYLIYIVYFTPIAHDRFGSVRQQFWTLLHLPLHVAIVLTEEGSAATLLWNTCINARYRLTDNLPSLTEPSVGYATISDFVGKINSTLTNTAGMYTYLKLKEEYNWYPDLDRIKNISLPYASDAWNEQAGEILRDMVNETSVFFFENFKFELDKNSRTITDANQKLAAYYASETVIFTYFFVAAGCLLLILGAMYWLGKNNKTWEEYTAILIRFTVGIALPFVSIAAYTQAPDRGFMFLQAGWIISVVTFCYLAVVIVDNVVQNVYDKRYLRKIAKGDIDPENVEHKSRDNGAFGPTVSHEATGMIETTDHAMTSEPKGSPNRKNVHIQAMSRSTVGSGSGSESYTGLPAGLRREREDSSPASDERTLSGHRDSEQINHIAKQSPSHPSNTIPRKQLRTERPVNNDWQTQPLYNAPRTRGNNSGYDRIDTEYRPHEGGMLDDVDLERGHSFSEEFRNVPSFEEERSPMHRDNQNQ